MADNWNRRFTDAVFISDLKVLKFFEVIVLEGKGIYWRGHQRVSDVFQYTRKECS